MSPHPYTPAEDTFLLEDSISGLGEMERAADIGCSTGYITSALLKKAAEVVSIDIDQEALAAARERLSHEYGRTHLIQAWGLTAIRDGGVFDVVASNPPYLPDEDVDDATIFGGPTGVETSVAILAQASTRLRRGGLVLMVASTLADLERLEDEACRLGFRIGVKGSWKGFFEEVKSLIFIFGSDSHVYY